MALNNILIWFRNDLRLTDNELLEVASKKGNNITPIFIFDPHHFEKVNDVFHRSSFLKTKFLLESVLAFKQQLRDKGGDLIIRIGNPKEIIPELCEQYNCNRVYVDKIATTYQQNLDYEIEKKLAPEEKYLDYFYNNTLVPIYYLPFPINKTPEDFKTFQRELNSVWSNLFVHNSNINLNFSTSISDDYTPEIDDLGDWKHEYELHFPVGKENALKYLKALVNEEFQNVPELTPYKYYLNNNFSKILPWLSLGTISPRGILFHIENEYPQNKDKKNTLKLFREQFLRLDFFKLLFYKEYEKDLDAEENLNPLELKKFKDWINGETDNTLINAIMKKLKHYGNISLTSKNLSIKYYLDILNLPCGLGYQYFSSRLIDYDLSLNLFMWQKHNEESRDPNTTLEEIAFASKKMDKNASFSNYWNEYKSTNCLQG